MYGSPCSRGCSTAHACRRTARGLELAIRGLRCVGVRVMSITKREARARRAAEDLAEAIGERLAAYEPLRASGARIAVTVKDGVAHLRGQVRSATQPFEAARAAGAVPGITDVRTDELRSDEQITVDVATALAQDAAVARATLRVRVALGLVTLRGAVSDARIVERAAALSGTVPGVQRVRSEIVVRTAAVAGSSETR